MVVLLLAGCRWKGHLQAIARDYPKAGGSTSTRPLRTMLACKIFDVPCRWTRDEELLLASERLIVPDVDLEDPPRWRKG